VLVTGVSPAGIGYTTALGIASQFPELLILASRTQSKLGEVVSSIAKKYPSVRVKTVLLDLASINSITSAAEEVNSFTGRIDVLINNAGMNPQTRDPLETPGGTTVDTQFFVNHLGPFLFTHLLLPRLRTASESSPKGSVRVVNLSSQGHRLSPIRFSDYAFERDVYDVPESEQPRRGLPEHLVKATNGYPGFLAYGQSKTANILHATELTRRLRGAGAGVVAFSVHPGSIETELSRHLDPAGREAISKTAPKGLWKTQDQGAATTLVAAFDPRLGEGEHRVGYLNECQLADDTAAEHATNPDFAKRLWEESERMLRISNGSRL